MFMVVTIQIMFPEAAHYGKDHAARRPQLQLRRVLVLVQCATLPAQRSEKRTGSEVRAAHRSCRCWRWACLQDREETLADNEEEESLPEVNMTRNIAECIESVEFSTFFSLNILIFSQVHIMKS